MAVAQPGISGASLFKQLEILPVPCESILSLMTFIVSNQEIFQTDSLIHNIKTRNKHHLHRPILCVKMMLFYGIFVVFYPVKFVYICVNMTCSTSCCFCDTRIQGIYVCIGVLLN